MTNLKIFLGLGILVLTMLGTIGAFFMKLVTYSLKNLSIKNLVQCPFLYLSGCCYVVATLINVFLLKHINYSVLYPMTSLTYVWTTIWAHVFLKERISKHKIIAILFIIFGVFLLNTQ